MAIFRVENKQNFRYKNEKRENIPSYTLAWQTTIAAVIVKVLSAVDQLLLTQIEIVPMMNSVSGLEATSSTKISHKSFENHSF